MATATVPKLVLTVNHASGRRLLRDGGQGFDPDFIFTWPTGRMGVMEGDSAVMALFSAQLDALKKEGRQPDEELQGKMDSVRAEYEKQLDARYAAARGFVDAVIHPDETRRRLRSHSAPRSTTVGATWRPWCRRSAEPLPAEGRRRTRPPCGPDAALYGPRHLF
jgi:acetyl-CoA carboxylase carboxyltransferase component